MAASTAPALDTPELLRLDPKVALCVIASYHNEENIVADYVNVTVPTVVTGRRSNVVFTPSAQGQQGGLGREYIGTYDLTYNRLDFTEFFSNLDSSVIVDTMPTTSREIANRLGEEYNIVFTEDDIEETPVTESMTTVVLRAPARSLRWVGELTVDVLYYPRLENVVIPRDLPGFDMFDVGSGLEENIIDPALDGFVKPDLFDYISPGILAGHWTSIPTNMVTDTGLSSSEMFLSALKMYSGVQFGLDDFEEMVVSPSDLGVDVSVDLVAREESFFTGASKVHFNRNDIRLMFYEYGARVINEGEFTPEELAGLLNAEGNIALTEEDFTYIEEFSDGEEFRGRIEMAANNLAWKGTLPVHVIPPWDFTPVIENMTIIAGTEYYRLNNHQAVSKGPQDRGVPIDYFNLGTWLLDVTDGLCTLTKPNGATETLTIQDIDLADHVDIGFDQNGGLLVVFTVAGNIKLYWYNPQAGQIQVDDLGPGTTPYISLSNYNVVLDTPEVLLVYARGGDMRYRRQLDRYDTEYSLDVGNVGAIMNTEFDILDRYIVEYFDTQTSEVRNVTTHSGSSWTMDLTPPPTAESQIVTFVVRDGIVYPETVEEVPQANAESEVQQLAIEYVEIHDADGGVEEVPAASTTAAIMTFQVTDGTYYASAGEETVPEGTFTLNAVSASTQLAEVPVDPGSDEIVPEGAFTLNTFTVTTVEE